MSEFEARLAANISRMEALERQHRRDFVIFWRTIVAYAIAFLIVLTLIGYWATH